MVPGSIIPMWIFRRKDMKTVDPNSAMDSVIDILKYRKQSFEQCMFVEKVRENMIGNIEHVSVNMAECICDKYYKCLYTNSKDFDFFCASDSEYWKIFTDGAGNGLTMRSMVVVDVHQCLDDKEAIVLYRLWDPASGSCINLSEKCLVSAEEQTPSKWFERWIWSLPGPREPINIHTLTPHTGTQRSHWQAHVAPRFAGNLSR